MLVRSLRKMKLLIIFVVLGTISRVLSDQTAVLDKFFKNMGAYQFTNELGEERIKTYYASQDFKLTWANALTFCRSFGMELVELDTGTEADYFNKLCSQNINLFTSTVHIGGSDHGNEKNKWYWMSSGKEIKYNLKYAPTEPNNINGRQNCLALYIHPKSFEFADYDCDESKSIFACQRVTSICNHKWIDPDCTPKL